MGMDSFMLHNLGEIQLFELNEPFIKLLVFYEGGSSYERTPESVLKSKGNIITLRIQKSSLASEISEPV